MTAIMFGTKYYNGFRNAVNDAEGLPILRVFHETTQSEGEWQNHIYVQIEGKVDPMFKIGEQVTVQTGSSVFSGDIWYIYQGTSKYNLYVHTPNAANIPDSEGGRVFIGPYVPIKETKTVLQQEMTEGETKAAEEANAEISNNIGPKTTSLIKKVWPLGLLLIAGIVLIYVSKKKKKG